MNHSKAGSLWKVIGLEYVMSVITKNVSFIMSCGLTHRQFKSFLLKIEAECSDVAYHNHVQWQNIELQSSLEFLTDTAI